MAALLRSAITTGLAIAMISSGAEAMPRLANPQASVPVKPAARMLEADQQPTPIGYVMFCMTYAGQCKRVAGGKRVILNDRTWNLFSNVNKEVNDRIVPDAQKGTFDWSLTATSGNCNDYAIQKRDELIRRGVSPAALSLSAVVTPRNEGHLILTIRTDRGDFVLDNLRNSIVAWNRTGYRWVSVQSNSNPNEWVKVVSES
ncbi:transglutaminase-like protein (plasmid) [Rhizobium gallicum]|uniref:Transglutaminase-like protein n=1 Tax=Rhizobium gallicum TaxID=56730 RepID=A0A1L5NX91_9HYPH|nr:transglutaminase-like cysteine peptidase [Rhizobium gallicum]APO72533.1 transglutaminase-like protein [Rhizobium gallicum]